jgi:hypothetical protein
MPARTALFSRRFPGGVFTVENVVEHPGAIFFVSSGSGSSTYDGSTPDTALATVAQALSLCTASAGDTIYLMPGHNEGIGNAQLTWNVAGVRIIGLGQGSTVPRIDFDHANASIDITANGVLVRNIRLLPSVTAVLVGIDVNAGATDVILEDVEVLPGEDGAGVDEMATAIDIKAGCTRTTIRRFKHRQHASAAGVIAPIKLTGASDDVLIADCDIVAAGAGLVAPINGDTTLSTNVRVLRCVLQTDAEPGVELLTGTTGIIADCSIFGDLATVAAAIVADGCAAFRNEYIEVAPERGVLIGTASAND